MNRKTIPPTARLTALILFTLLILSACTAPKEYGVLEGHVTIGPLSPVQREGEAEPVPAPEVYAARQIVVFNESVSVEVVRIQIDSDGNYRAELPAGEYVVDINHSGIDSAAGLPATVVIEPGSTVQLDIDIDTGIR